MRVLAAALAAVVAATMAWSSAEAVDVQIDGFPFVCKSPEGEFLKPKFGDVDGIYFTGLPAARKPCLETIDRMIYSCTANTTFISHDLNNQYPDCLPTFERQAEQCVRHFEQERQKCYADDSSTPDQPAAEVVSSSRDDAGDVEIKGFSFGCTTPDGETRKPWYGGVDGTRFADIPSEREACLSLLSYKISSCRKNISFADHRQNRTFAACLPIFKGQVQDCVRHFEQERHKCYAGDSSAPAATTAEPKEPEVEPADLTMWAAKRSNIRSGPGTDHAKVGLLEVGDEVQVRGEIGDWLRITAPDGGDAFVYAPLLADADPVMDLDPKCQGFGKAKSCWLEITGRPNCYVWVSYLPDAFENVSWSGQCSGGFARGKGVLEVRYSDGHDMNIVGALSAGKFHGQIVFTYRDGKPFGGGFYVDGEQQFNIDVDQKPEISESTSAAATAATARALDIPDKATRVRVADRMKSCGNMRWSLIDYGGTFSTLNSEAKMRRFIKRVGRYGNSAVAMAKRYLDKCTPVSVRLLQSEPSCVVLERDRGISVELLDRIIRQPERYLDSNSQLNDTQRSTVTKYLRDCVQVYATAMDSGSMASIARAEDKPSEVATTSLVAENGPLHGSIAFSQESDGGYAWGIAWSFDNRAGALAEARDQCREYGGSYCAEVGWFQEACGALAIGDGNGYGAGWGDTKAAAERDALAQCRAANTDCRVEVARCSQSQEAGGKGRRQEEDKVEASTPKEDEPATVVLEPKCLAQPLYVGSRCWKELSNKPGCHFWIGSHNLHIAPTTDVPTTWSGSCAAGTANGKGVLMGKHYDWPIRFTGALSNGKKHGYWVEVLYDTDGSEFSWNKGSYVEGDRHGDWTEATDGGSRCDIVKYSNDTAIDAKINAC